MIALKEILISTLLFLCLVACNPNLDSALEQAGENREEMEKVLDHFKNDPDTLKYSAAKFFIENMPRTDGNCIEIGDKYELKFWDSGSWRVLPEFIAKNDILAFKNMPKNGLYVLTDKTKGKDQRIFTYEDGKQVWW